MTEITERPFEEKQAEVTDWVARIENEGVVFEIDPQLVKEVLEGLGASKEISEDAKVSLAKYSNLGKRYGLD